jgi:murein hydrolase activator
LRIQYAESIVFAYKNRSSYDFLNFIFSATTFNDAMRRIEYLKSYRAYREERAENIRNTQALLQSKIDGLRVTRAEKDDVLKKASKEKEMLDREKQEKDAVVSQLQSQEKELKKEMAAKQRQDQKLSGAISAAVKRARDMAIKEATTRQRNEAAQAAADKAAAVKAGRSSDESAATTDVSVSAAEPAKLNTVKSSSKSVFTSDADIHLSDDFFKNKTHLPWPVTGTISMAFGKHEYIPGVVHDNIGVTIDVAAGAAVKAVFKGEVQSVFSVGDVSAVMIRHGKYFTTYSNLSTVSVNKGDQVTTGQIIGRVGEIGQLEFVLSDENRHNYDPERWLRK